MVISSTTSTIAAKDTRPYKANRLYEIQQANKEAYPNYLGERLGVHRLEVSQIIERWSNINPGDKHQENVMRVTGRITAIREASSKLFFFDIIQNGHRLQIVGSLANLRDESTLDPAEKAANFRSAYRRLHRGDIVEIIGFPGKTGKGELSIFSIQEPTLLAPCLHDLPLREGLSTVEKRFRNRHVDLLVNPNAANTLKIRAQIIRYIRQFLDQRGFLEVETPILSMQAGGANARPFTTIAQAIGNIPLFLRVAPELYLKQLVIGGFDRVYEIGKQFRNEGIDADHNPEFTTCEFYQAYADLEDLISLTEDMLSGLVKSIHGSTTLLISPTEASQTESDDAQQLNAINFTTPFRRIDVVEALEKALGPLPDLEAPDAIEQLLALCHQHHIQVSEPRTVPRILDRLISEYIEPQCQQPTFIYGHPVVMSPLAKSTVINGRKVSARFELFVQGKELVNAYEELNDPEEQRRRFLRQQEERRLGDNEAPLPDEAFCDALEYGLPPTGGWGMGIDRVCALLAGVHHLRETFAFPLMKPRV